MAITDTIYKNSPVWMQHILVSAYGMKWQKRRYGGIYSENYKAAKEREAFTMQQWQNFQQEQLTKILLHAYGQVPYYINSDII